MNKYCHGCGYHLQTEKKEDLGYIKKIDESKDVHYCLRCYNMIFRNQPPEKFLEENKYWELFDEISSNKCLKILVLDIFNLEGSIIKKVIQKLKNNKVLLVLNKRDILPKLIKDQKIINNVLENEEIQKLDIVDTIVVSSKKKYNIDELLNSINVNRNNKDVYLIGAANVGKSSLLNALINAVVGDNKEYISTSYFAGTTLGIINVPLDEKNNLIDTPGLINEEDLTMHLDKESLEIIIPKKEIRLVTYQLNEEQTIFLTGFVQLDYIQGNKQGVTIYASNQIDIHRTKLENAKEIRKKHLGEKLLSPPNKNELKELKFKTIKIEIPKGNYDIVISGLGWINIKNENSLKKYEITVPEKISIKVREGII